MAKLQWLLTLCLLLLLLQPTQGLALDFQQCDRRCAQEFPAYANQIHGKKISTNLCECKKGRQTIGRISRLYPISIPTFGLEVCGSDGVTYPTQEEAEKHTKALHGGTCGACSNERDIAIYRQMAKTLSPLTASCAKKYIILGEKSGVRCFDRVGLSKGCSKCWTENIGCTAAHCLKTCMRVQRDKIPPIVNGQLNDCLRCDEIHCGKPFIDCAGANRRRSGIVSDIERPDDDFWDGIHE